MTLDGNHHLRQMMQDLAPELQAWLVGDEEMSEVLLATQMIWLLVVTGKKNEEACIWAGKILSEVMLDLAPEGIQPLINNIKQRLSQGQAPASIGKDIRENAREVWGAFSEHYVASIAERLAKE